MGLTFLAPLFLAGLIGLAIPVIVHLVHKEKPEGIPFPSLMFLQQIPVKSKRRQRIRHWLLFALRCLALALLAAAFSRPFLSGLSVSTTTLDGGREIVVLLDRSMSMSYQDRWDRAVNQVGTVIDGVGPEDRVSIVAFDEQAEVLNQPTGEAAALRAALTRAELSSGRTRYAAAFKLAESIFDGSDLPRREVVVVSDFQRTGWDADDVQRLPVGAEIRVVDLSAREAPNVTVASVAVRREPRGDREMFHASARVFNTGDAVVSDLPVSLELNGQQLHREVVNLPANEATTVHFESALVPDGVGRGVIRVDTDQLPADDAFHFTVAAGADVTVLVLEGPSARNNQSLYLSRALSVGESPTVRVTAKPFRRVTATDIRDSDVIVLNEVAYPSGQVASLLEDHVRGGGGLLLALGDGSGTAWPATAATMVPGRPGAVVERRLERGASITDVDYGHPVFDAFSAPRSGDLSAAQFYRYRGFSLGDSSQTLARFDDGGIALAERRVGDGRVLIWTSSLDTYWNTLGLQPVFVPFLHEVVKYLADYSDSQSWYTVGTVADLAAYADRVPGGEQFADAFEARDQVVLETPEGERLRLDEPDQWLVRIAENGFYTLKASADAAAGLAFAANVDPVESDLRPLDVEEMVGAVQASTSDSATAAAGVASLLSVEDLEQRQGMWWYLLIGVLLLLTTETVLSNRLSRAVR